MPTGTTYIPSGYPLDSSRVSGNGAGVAATAAANTTTNLDMTLTDDMILTGVELIQSGASAGDYMTMTVMSGGTPVASPIPGPWYVAMSGDNSFDLIIPQKIVAGLTLRVTYHSTSLLGTPFVAINYRLWKVLS